MPKKLRVALIQNNAGKNWQTNFDSIQKFLQKASQREPHLIALPETFYFRGPAKEYARLAKEVTPYVVSELRQYAKKKKVSILVGSLLEPAAKKKFFNTSLLISKQGRVSARYRKIHLFDNQLPDVSIQESKHHQSGRQAVVGNLEGIKVGLSICYDLRFPELYRTLTQKGARILFVPANFTAKTGKAHWEPLLRSRAIENQAFVIAPGQVGKHPETKILSYGTSLVVDPWGKVLVRADQRRQQVVFADLDLDFQAKLRKNFPVLKHRKMGL